MPGIDQDVKVFIGCRLSLPIGGLDIAVQKDSKGFGIFLVPVLLGHLLTVGGKLGDISGHAAPNRFALEPAAPAKGGMSFAKPDPAV